KLLPKDILGIPRLGFLNVHFSLLPTYRGAAPIQWALINGEARTGVTLFWLDEGMDTGPLLAQEALDIGDDDAESLRRRLVALGAEVLASALQRLEAGEVIRRPQEGASSQAPPLKKEDGRIDWNKSAASIVQLIRGTTPWPGAYTVAAMPGGRNLRVKITRATALPDDHAGAPGEIRRVESGLGFDVKCHEGLLRVEEVQPEGKKAMPAWSFWQGARLKMGDKIG
ncbi:MAG TPA: methionyl-tRNA formyltransferase, partial [Elusimicrobiota bacterium]|nr:methionyl-tRNA formyltransferase [Elusimicrobiota bacterium]